MVRFIITMSAFASQYFLMLFVRVSQTVILEPSETSQQLVGLTDDRNFINSLVDER